MEARLQRRIQRYGWDRAARDYERLWQAQLASAHAQLLAYAALAPGYRIPAEFVVVAAAVPEAG